MALFLADVSDQILKVYGLNKAGLSFHDAVHAMTGFGIGLANEMRIRVIETSLNQTSGSLKNRTLKNAFKRHADFRMKYHQHLAGQRTYTTVPENDIDLERYQKLQLKVGLLNPREVERLFNLGDKMHRVIRDLTGHDWATMPTDMLAAIDFKDVDFTTEAHQIKTKYETPANRAVARATERLFFNALAGSPRQPLIPAAGSPWHGFGRKEFYPARGSVNRSNR